MKIAVVSMGRSHLLNLARTLCTKPDTEVTFYTMMPRSRCRNFGYTQGKIVSCFFPLGMLYFLCERIPGLSIFKRSHLRFLIRKAVDRFAAWRLRPCDVLVGINGGAALASVAARKKYGAVTICDQGSSHILTQTRVLNSYSKEPMPQWNIDYMLRHYEAVDYFMAASDYVKQTDLSHALPEDKILLNGYGVDTRIFRPTPNPCGDKEAYDVIMVGSWWKHKGCDMLLTACLDILKVRLLHVGPVIDCPVSDSPLFRHENFVPENELPAYYAKAKVFVLPSLDEGFGLVLLQAAACGLPFVYSKNTGGSCVKKLLGATPAGVQIEDPLNPQTIAAAIRTALDFAETLPPGLRETPAEILKNITWEAYGERYYRLLGRILRKA